MDPLRSISNLSNKLRKNPILTSTSTPTTPISSIIKPKPTGKLSSLHRNWSATSNAFEQPPHSNSITSPSSINKKHPPPSSSQPSWQADESEWPPSPPPPSKKIKRTGSTTLTSTSTTATATATATRTTKSNPTHSSIRYPPPSSSSSNAKQPKASFPWEVTRNPKPVQRSNAFNQLPSIGNRQNGASIQNHLNNPNMSIAAKVSLSPEQQDVLDSVLKGKSIFFTGSAGTGKSVLLRHIISALKRTYATRSDAVAITASTGMAACAIGGTTIHSFAGIGLGQEPADRLVRKVQKNRKAAGKWIRAKVLIIDEISMVDGELFDKLAYIAQKLRKSTKPFGGLQIVVAGDFFQLPPVTSNGKTSFAFNAQSWSQCIPVTINLTQVFRQKDSTFINMLNEMRMGELSSSSIERFRKLSRELTFNDGIEPTELYPTRNEVERSNNMRLQALKTDQEVYVAVDGGKASPEQRARDLANLMAVPTLVLKKDAQVMMIKNQNTEDGPTWLVNGLVGRVLDFVDPAMSVDQYLLSLKEELNGVDLSGIFTDDEEDDDKSVKPSPFPPLRGSAKNNPPPNVDPIFNQSNDPPVKLRQRLPVVEWFLMNGKREITIVDKAEFKVENLDGEVQSRRVQIPLILAWAMSIHKSQGQTLQRVKVDLGRVFEKGQIYVALSRATSLEGLQVLRFDPKKVMAHPDVIKWSKENLTCVSL